MSRLKRVFRYIGHYGVKSALGVAKEKLLIDPKRFSPDKKRTLPGFDLTYKKAMLPQLVSDGENYEPLTVMYLIHYFYPERKGGTERFTLNLAKTQKELGNSPIVLVLDANEPKSLYTERCGNILYRYYEHEGIECIGFRHIKAPLGLYYKSVNLNDNEMKAFAKFITEKHSVDVVHATYPQPFASFLMYCLESDIPYVATCTDFCMMCHYSTMVDTNGDFCVSTEEGKRCSEICKTYGCRDFAERRANAAKVLSGAEIVTVPSDFVARVMGNEYKEVSFVPVPHGISSAFEYKERQGRVKKFVYAGTLTALKGVHMLIESFNSLEQTDITLDIYGEGNDSYTKQLLSLAGERVKLHGAVPGDKMPEIYSCADCVIVPSMWYETYNFVLREALMTGAFVLSANIGAMPEAVKEGENGYLFAPSDREALTVAMKKALEFDFGNYSTSAFPSLRDEGAVYFAIYRRACKK